jgi:integrase
LEAALSIDSRTYLIALLGGEGGMRAGEIVALEWADITSCVTRFARTW